MVLIGSYIEVLNGSRRFLVVAITVSEKNAKNFLHTFTMGDVAQKT